MLHIFFCSSSVFEIWAIDSMLEQLELDCTVLLVVSLLWIIERSLHKVWFIWALSTFKKYFLITSWFFKFSHATSIKNIQCAYIFRKVNRFWYTLLYFCRFMSYLFVFVNYFSYGYSYLKFSQHFHANIKIVKEHTRTVSFTSHSRLYMKQCL